MAAGKYLEMPLKSKKSFPLNAETLFWCLMICVLGQDYIAVFTVESRSKGHMKIQDGYHGRTLSTNTCIPLSRFLFGLI